MSSVVFVPNIHSGFWPTSWTLFSSDRNTVSPYVFGRFCSGPMKIVLFILVFFHQKPGLWTDMYRLFISTVLWNHPKLGTEHLQPLQSVGSEGSVVAVTKRFSFFFHFQMTGKSYDFKVISTPESVVDYTQNVTLSINGSVPLPSKGLEFKWKCSKFHCFPFWKSLATWMLQATVLHVQYKPISFAHRCLN